MLISVATVRILVINEAMGRTNTDRGCEGRRAEEGEYLLGDKYSTCMLNVDYALTMSRDITNMQLHDKH